MAVRLSNGTGGGPWSAVGSWAVAVPGLGDTAQIVAGDTITIDVTFQVGDDTVTPALDILNGGELDWDNLANDVCDFQGDFYVRNGGTLTLDGTANGGNTLTVQLNRSAAPAAGKYGLIIEDNAIVDCDGFDKTRSWDILSADAAAGQKDVVTTNDNSAIWNVGDEFVVGSMSKAGKAGAETDTIGGFAAQTITKAGANYAWAHEQDVAFINLTRNVVFTSHNVGFKGYIYITNNTPGNVAFDWVEFSYLGINVATKFGITVVAGDYMTANYCSLHHMYYGIRTGVQTLDNCVFGLNVYADVRDNSVGSTVASGVFLGSDRYSALNTRFSLLPSCHFGNIDSHALWNQVDIVVSASRFYGISNRGLYSVGVAAISDSYFDNCIVALYAEGSITKITDCFFGTVVANTTDIYSIAICVGTGINTTALTVTVTGSVDNRVSIEDVANNHKTWKAAGSYEKQAVIKYSGLFAALMNPTDAANELIAESTIFAAATETVAYSCYFRKSVAMAVLPYLRLSGAGVTPDTATMVDTQNDWQLMTVSGVPTRDGFCRVEFVCQNAAGNVYVDDDQDSYRYWYEGDVPSVVPKPELMALDLLNAMVTGIGFSPGVFGDVLQDMLADTDELQTDWADGGRLDLLIDAIKAVTDLLPDGGALNDLALIKAVTDLLPDGGALNDLALIKAVTDLLPDGGALNDLALILAITNLLPDGGALNDLALIRAVTDLLPDGGALNDLALTLAIANLLPDGGALNDLALIKAVTDLLPDGGALNDLAATLAAVNAIPGDVWDELLAAHTVAGSAGVAQAASGAVAVFPAGAIAYTYTVTDADTGLPVAGADVWFATDALHTNNVWRGSTDAFGVARDVYNNLPLLDAGTYFIRVQHVGYASLDDTEIVS